MKVIIAGATGYIGQEILTQCIAHPSITSIVALTRRDLDIKNDKLRTYLMKDEDFLTYSDPKLRDELKNASACLWSIGLRPSQAGNDERTRVISVDYPAAAAANMAEIASTSAPGRKLRFVYISGSGVERDQNKSLWWMGNFRRLRGESENVLLRHAEANPDAFEAYIMRPSLVPSRQGTIRDRVWSMFPSVRMDLLARAMIDIALNGNEETTIENQTINEWP